MENKEYSTKLDPSPETTTKEPEKAVVEAPKPKRTRSIKKGSIKVGDYEIRVRPGSGYAVLYRIMAEEGNFEGIEERLEKLDVKDEKACSLLFKSIMVERSDLEAKIRDDAEFQAYCDKRTAALKKQAADGSKRAKAILENPQRSENGRWKGNIREMLSVCNGSSSSAGNRNLDKYKEANIAFRQFPRMPRRKHNTYIMMVPSKYLEKLDKALHTVFGDEKSKDFVPYLDTKLRSIFGTI